MFRFDWFIKSRTPAELNRRADALLKMIDKEIRDLNSAGGSGRRVKKFFIFF